MPWRFNPFTGNLDETDIPAFNGEVTLGSAASPSIFFTGDPNTGIYSPGADQVAISTNGTGRLFVTSAGSIGVGTSTPNKIGASKAITVNGTDAAIELSTGDLLKSSFYTNGTDTVLSNSVAGALRFYTDSAERLRITSTGQLSHIGAGSSGSPAVSFNGSAPSNSLVIDSTGKVGLGTSSPSTRFHVSESNAGGYASVLLLSNSANSAADRTGIYGSAAPGTASPYRAGITFWPGAAGAMSFHTGNNATPGEGTRMHITGSGNVGVGTTSPAATLHSRADNAGSSSTPFLIQNRSVSANTAVGISFAPNTSDTSDRSAIIYGVNSSGGSGNATDLTFHTNANGSSPTEKARIDSSGRLLVGTSTTSDTKAKLGVAGSVNIGAGSGNSVTLADGATGTVATPVRGYSYINISHTQTASDGLLLLVFANTTTLTIISTVHSNAGSRYSASVSGRNLQVTNSLGVSATFYASCMTLAWGDNG